MNYFPMFMMLKGRIILVCGGGKHAMEKIERLRPFQPILRVISECCSPEMEQTPDITVAHRKLTIEDLETHPVFVIAAENKEENKRIAGLCRQMHIPVNAVDQPEDCDFIFPSMIVTQQLCVGVSTGGVSPTGAICLKNAFTQQIPDDIDEILLWVKHLKEHLNGRQVEKNLRNQILRLVMSTAMAEGRILSKTELATILRKENLNCAIKF